MMSTIVVQNGGTLFGVAAAYYSDATQWIRIAAVNGTRDPFFLDGAVTLTLPRSMPVQGQSSGT